MNALIMIRFTCLLAALAFASGALSDVRAQSSPDYGPFDPARIGLPGLTEQGIDYLIEQHRKLIEEGQKAITDLQAKQPQPSNAEAVIERYQETIRQEMAQIARLAGERTQTATQIAESGRVDDVPALQSQLTTVLEASRFNQLFGNEKEALKQWKAAAEIFKNFSSKFLETCYKQSFDPAFALGLERQNEMLGTGIDVTPCAKRRRSFVPKPGYDEPLPGTFAWGWKFEEKGCSLDGGGKWKLTVDSSPWDFSGSAEFELESSDDGKRAEGEFDVTIHSRSGDSEFHCKVELFVREGKDKNGKVKRETLAKVTKTKEVNFYPDHQPWKKPWPHMYDALSGEFPVKLSDKPCRE